MTPQRFSMRDGEQSDANCLTILVHVAFHVHANRTCALIQYGELRFVIEQSCHLNKASKLFNQL